MGKKRRKKIRSEKDKEGGGGYCLKIQQIIMKRVPQMVLSQLLHDERGRLSGRDGSSSKKDIFTAY